MDNSACENSSGNFLDFSGGENLGNQVCIHQIRIWVVRINLADVVKQKLLHTVGPVRGTSGARNEIARHRLV